MEHGVYNMYDSNSAKTRKGKMKEYCSKVFTLYVKWCNIS